MIGAVLMILAIGISYVIRYGILYVLPAFVVWSLFFEVNYEKIWLAFSNIAQTLGQFFYAIYYLLSTFESMYVMALTSENYVADDNFAFYQVIFLMTVFNIYLIWDILYTWENRDVVTTKFEDILFEDFKWGLRDAREKKVGFIRTVGYILRRYYTNPNPIW